MVRMGMAVAIRMGNADADTMTTGGCRSQRSEFAWDFTALLRGIHPSPNVVRVKIIHVQE